MNSPAITGWTMLWLGLVCAGTVVVCLLGQSAWLAAMGAL